jgi:crossover junction endodeoxyribonuclease RuvC
MIILGVDPGTVCTGYGIVSFDGNTLSQITSGIINIPATKDMAPRLKIIYDELDRLIKLHNPDEFAIETAFYGKNVQSAMKIGYARGVALLAAIKNDIPAKEYSPREIKKSVVGKGAATKEQVQFMIFKLLAMESEKIKYDQSDALAAAICHAFKKNSSAHKSGNWKSFIKANPGRIIE